MNRIGIIGAMEEEVAMLKEQMKDVTVKEKAAMEFFHGTLNKKEVVVVRSGIGKVNAGICVQILADDYQVDAVINTGIAGSLKAESTLEILYFPQTRCIMTWMQQNLGIRLDKFRVWMFMLSRQMKLYENWQRQHARK